MSRRRRLVLLGVVAAQIALPLALAAVAAADLAFGREIRLRAQPVDPLDIFRGNYVVLRYDISTLPVQYDTDRGERLCVALREEDGEWRGTYALPGGPGSGASICGRARSDARAGEQVTIEYGIETYFASAERAKEIERSIAEGRTYAVLDLDDDGSARVKRLEFER